MVFYTGHGQTAKEVKLKISSWGLSRARQSF